MILDFILEAVGSLLQSVTYWEPTPRQRVKRALRLSRRRRLTAERRDYAIGSLTYGLANLTDLRLESREPEIRKALETMHR